MSALVMCLKMRSHRALTLALGAERQLSDECHFLPSNSYSLEFTLSMFGLASCPEMFPSRFLSLGPNLGQVPVTWSGSTRYWEWHLLSLRI